jgi:cell division initiation protein
MDVTPHDLRNAELREAFRGYRPDEVEELLERAAITLERMHDRTRQLQEKLATLEAEGSTAKEMESVLHQTLLLAQRTAEETVTAAHERARQLLEESEDRALTLTAEAEEYARIEGESQRQKYEAIVAELSARRDSLALDIEALEQVQADYRARLRAILEQELEDLDRRATLPRVDRPGIEEIDLGTPESPPASEPESTPPLAASETESIFVRPSGSADVDDGGPPTVALVVLEEELADSGQTNGSARHRA